MLFWASDDLAGGDFANKQKDNELTFALLSRNQDGYASSFDHATTTKSQDESKGTQCWWNLILRAGVSKNNMERLTDLSITAFYDCTGAV